MRRIGVVLVVVGVLLVPAGASANSARQEYQRIWKQDRQFFAPGMPSPLVKFGRVTPGADASTTFVPDAAPIVKVSRGATRGLRQGNEKARQVVEWEWLRVFGPADQGPLFPRSPMNALLHYHHGHTGSPLKTLRADLPHWGENPRRLVDPPPVVTYSCPEGKVPAAGGGCCPPDLPYSQNGLCQAGPTEEPEPANDSVG